MNVVFQGKDVLFLVVRLLLELNDRHALGVILHGLGYKETQEAVRNGGERLACLVPIDKALEIQALVAIQVELPKALVGLLKNQVFRHEEANSSAILQPVLRSNIGDKRAHVKVNASGDAVAGKQPSVNAQLLDPLSVALREVLPIDPRRVAYDDVEPTKVRRRQEVADDSRPNAVPLVALQINQVLCQAYNLLFNLRGQVAGANNAAELLSDGCLVFVLNVDLQSRHRLGELSHIRHRALGEQKLQRTFFGVNDIFQALDLPLHHGFWHIGCVAQVDRNIELILFANQVREVDEIIDSSG
ncbi:hypothetical protein D9M72_370640 [compost metagenome]